MKKLLNLVLIVGVVFLVGCKDDEPEVDPLVGFWELDDVSLEFAGFSIYNYDNENDIFGESSYTIELLEDFTYERELDFTTSQDIADEGEWETDGEFLDLNTNDDEIPGLGYSFNILQVDDISLVLELETEADLFPEAKIIEWFDNGTLDANGSFTVTETEFDSLVTNFISRGVQGIYTIEFDRR